MIPGNPPDGNSIVEQDHAANPAYADGRLYLRDGLKATGNLYCLELMR